MKRVNESIKRIILKEDTTIYDAENDEYVDLYKGDVIDVVSENDDEFDDNSYIDDEFDNNSSYIPPMDEDDDELSFDNQGNAINYSSPYNEKKMRRNPLNKRRYEDSHKVSDYWVDDNRVQYLLYTYFKNSTTIEIEIDNVEDDSSIKADFCRRTKELFGKDAEKVKSILSQYNLFDNIQLGVTELFSNGTYFIRKR